MTEVLAMPLRKEQWLGRALDQRANGGLLSKVTV